MWRWLGKSRADSHVHDLDALPGEETGRDSKFRLESLEPRLLLSGDPVLAELARWVADDGSASDAEELSVIVQEIDLAAETEIRSGNGADESGDGGQAVAWPAGWVAPSDYSEIKEAATQIRFSESGPVDLLSVVTSLVGHVTGDSEAGDEASQLSSDSSDEAAAVTDSISSEQLNGYLEKAIEVLSTTDSALADKLVDIRFQVADLAEGVIAEIRGNVIYVDVTAAGHGWVLDSLFGHDNAAAGDSHAAATDAAADSDGDMQPQAQDLFAELTASQGQGDTSDNTPVMVVEAITGGASGPSENGQSEPTEKTGHTGEDADVGTAASEAGLALDQFQTESSLAGQNGPDTMGDNGAASANSPADLLQQVLDLVGLATGLQGDVDAGDGASDLAIGVVAASHRLQESNRSARSELRKDNSKTTSTGETGSDQGSQATESEMTVTAEGGDDATPRGPPAVEEDQAVIENDSSDTAQGSALVSLLYDEDAPATVSTDTEMPRAPPANDEQPRAPPTVADMPRAPPANDNTEVLSVTASSSSASQPDTETTHDEVDYLNSTGDPGASPTGEDLTGVDITTDTRLQDIINEAIARWLASGLTPADLTTVSYVIADLSGSGDALGSYDGASNTITIDDDADGFGWFIDTSPTEDSEFDAASPTGVDLLTVLMHELGHAYGYAHAGEDGLQGNSIMVTSLDAGVRLGLQIDDGTRLNDVINIILATLDSTNPPVTPQVFSSTDALVPNLVTIGTTASGGVDLQLEGITLTFSGLSYVAASEWDGEVQVEAELGHLLPGQLDIIILDDDFGAPLRVESASAAAGTGPRDVTFTVSGDQTDIESGDVIAVLNSNEAGFDDTDFNDGKTITVVSSSYSDTTKLTTLVVSYNFDPGTAAWTGGSVIALEDSDPTDDVDLDAVFGTIYLAKSDPRSLLRLESLKAADLGWPSWLDIQITDLKLEFTDFRTDDSDSSLKLDAAFRGLDTGNGAINFQMRKLFIVEGSASGVVFDMDILATAHRTSSGAVEFVQNPILDLSGVAGRIKATLPNITFDVLFIVKSVGIDKFGNMTSETAQIERTILYAALGGQLKYGGVQPAGPADKDGKLPPKIGGYDFGFRLAISELGPLQLYVFAKIPIILDPVSGLKITSLSGGISFFSTVEDKQIRPPYTASGGSAASSGDAQSPVKITLTLPGHNLRPGDEIRILSAGDQDLVSKGRDTFVVTGFNGDDVTYLTGGGLYESDPNEYTFGGKIEVRKVSISNPFDLNDPGFKPSKGLTLEQWEDQLDKQVVIQANLGDNLWLGLLSNLTIEASASLELHTPRVVVALDVDLLFDTQGHIMLTGTMIFAGGFVKIPVRMFADLSNVGDGSFSMLFLAELPKGIAGLDPLVVIYAGVTFETIIGGVPATLDALTGFPAGVGADVTGATINDLSGIGAGPWEVTFTLNSTTVDKQFEVGDTIAVVGSDPDSFNGNYYVTGVTSNTVTFLLGSVILDGKVDVDNSGVIDALDNATLSGIPVLAGLLDYNKDGVIDANDDGEIFNFLNDASGNRRVVSYAVIDGRINVDDGVVIGINPQIWTEGFDLTRDIVSGQVDVDGNGIVDVNDFGSLGGIVVAEGRLDINRDGAVDNTDDGVIQNVVIDAAGNRIITTYNVVDGYLDIDGDLLNPLTDTYVADVDDSLALNLSSDQGGYWIEPGFAVANVDDLGDGLRISVNGGVDINIPFVTTLSLNGSATLDFIFGGAEDVRVNFNLKSISLSETTVGAIGTASGDLTLTMDRTGGPVVDGVTLPKVEIWGAAILSSDFSFLEQFGLFADVSGLFIINSSTEHKPPITLQTTGGEVTVTPTKQTFSLRMDGSLGLRVDFNDNQSFEDSEQIFLLTGTFVFSISSAQGLNIALFSESGPASNPTVGPATLQIGPSSAPWLTFNAFGFLAIQKNDTTGLYGIAANIILSLDASAPGDFASVASIDAQFVLILNTIGKDVTFNIPAGADDPNRPNTVTSLAIPRAPPNSILDANLDITSLISGTAWTVDANVLGGAYILIHLGGTDPASNPNAVLNLGPFSLSGQFSFLLGATVASDGSVSPLLEIVGHVEADISFGTGPSRLTLFKLEGDAYLRFDNSGLVAAISLTQKAGVPAQFGFSLGGSTNFLLQINTTGSAVTGFDHDGDPNSQALDIATGFRLHMAGQMDLAGILTLEGTFDLAFDKNTGAVTLDITAHFKLFGARADFTANASLTSQGFVLNARLSLAGLTIGPLLSINGGFTLFLDTTTGSFTVSVHDANNANLPASVNMMGLVMKGKMTIGIIKGEFFIDVPEGAELTLNFFNVATFKVSGHLSFNVLTGEAVFKFDAKARMVIGEPGLLGVDVQVTMAFDSAVGKFTSTITGTAWVAGFSITAKGSLTVSGSLIKLYFSISVTITPGFWFWDPWNGSYYVNPVRVSYSHTFNIGHTTEQDTINVPPPPPPVLAHRDSNDSTLLYLNMGVDAGLRDPKGDWDDEDISESFRVTHRSGVAGNETVRIEAFGFKKDFSGVAKIVVINAGDGEDIIDIGAQVLADADLHGGNDNDSISYLGSGQAVLYGDDGNDLLKGGSGGTLAAPDLLYGGKGNDRVQAGSGYSNVYGNDGDDTLVWDQASGAVLGVIDGGNDTGTDFRDMLLVLAGNTSDTASISAAQNSDFTVSFGAGNATATAIEGIILDLMDGSDSVTVNDVSATSLTSVILRLGQNSAGTDDDGKQDSIVLQAGTGTDNLLLQSTSQLIDVFDNDGNVTGQVLQESIAMEYNGQVNIAIEQSDAAGGNLATGDLLKIFGNGGNDTIDASLVTALLLNMQFFLGNDGGSILGSANADRIEVTVTGDTTGVLNLDGKGGGDNYIVNLLGGNTDTEITINDTGAGGTDAVVVNGTTGIDKISITGAVLKLGSNTETLNYSGLETFTVNTLGNADEVTIFSTHAGTTIVNSGDGEDKIAVRSVSGTTTINTGAATDRVNVGSNATVTTNTGGDVNSINALLTINGGTTGTDVLNVDDSGDTVANTDGQLTTTNLTGLGMSHGIAYSAIEDLTIHLGSANDEFLVISTITGRTTVNGNVGSDTISLRSIAGATFVNTHAGSDRINVGSNASAASNTGGTVNGINALLTVNGGTTGTDVLDVDDRGDNTANTDGVLTGTNLTGLGMSNGIAYSALEDLRVHLGLGSDVFIIKSTHAGSSQLNANGGGDVINVRTISGATGIDSGIGSDTINVGSNANGTTGNAAASQNNSNGYLNNIAALLTINGNSPPSGSDVLTIDDTLDTEANTGTLTATMLTGLDMSNGIAYSAIEHLIISLGDGGNTFTIEDTHGAATSGSQEDTVLNSGDGEDTVHINGATDQLSVNAQDEADIINVRGMIGTVTVNGDAGNDTINVSSQSPVLPGSATDQVGTVDAIDGLLTVNGGADSDVLNVDDSNPANTANTGKTGTLTAATLRGLEMPEGINYATLETLNIWLDDGDNVFNIDGTHGGTTSLYSMEGDDTVNVRATATGSTTNLYTQGDEDTINLSDSAPTLPANYPASLPPTAADTVGSIDDINGLVVIDGGLDNDTVNIDDSASGADKAAILKAGSLRGLDLEAGVDYSAAEDLNIWLGTGTDTFYIDSTHNGTTQLYAGDGNTTTGERDDTVAIRSISGATTVHGQGGNDGFLVNVEYDGGVPLPVGDVAANDTQFTRTHENNIGAVLNLHGEGGSDYYTVNLAGTGNALVNVHDLGDATDGDDTLVINGADTVEGIDNQPNDTFLLRLDFVALLNDFDSSDDLDFDRVERVNYDAYINAGLFVNSLGGNDAFFTDDNSTITTLNGGDGEDSFQIGQVFGTARTEDADIAPGDTFETTAVIIGVVRHPATGDVVFNPVEDELNNAAKMTILDAIADADDDQPVDGIAYVSNGVSHHTEINGGDGNDSFSVYHNKGTLSLNGDDDNDDFIVRAFVVLDGPEQGSAQVNGGSGGDSIQYTQNAPVSIDGGDGFDTIVVLGTPFGDSFVVSSIGVFGAGLTVYYDNVESVELDTLEGNDTVYVLSTNADLVTTIIGGQGNDTINIMGDVINPIVTNDPSADDLQDQNLGSIQGPLIIEGGPLADRDRSLNLAVVLPGESNKISGQESPLVEESESIDTLNIFHTDNRATQNGALQFRDNTTGNAIISNTGLALTGFGMGGNLTINEGTVDDPSFVTYGGGITYNGFEIAEVLLGKGNETLVISDTGDNDEKDPTVTNDPATITAIHGGGGDDTITITERGNGPLVIYGDTSEDGVRYSNETGDASEHGSSFNNPGEDTIDASGLNEQGDAFVGVVIYGGPGKDTITGSQDDDQLAGGSGPDDIDGEAGDDHIYGDSHFNINLLLFAQDQVSRFDAAIQLDDINDMFIVPTTGTGDIDTINGGTGNDVIFGDHGVIEQTEGTRRIESTGHLELLETVNLANGAGDTTHGDAGNDFIFGGVAGDTIYGDLGSDLIFGDYGKVVGDVDANAIGTVNGAGVENVDAVFTYTSDISGPANVTAGNDTIYGGSLVLLDTDTGNNILLGQQGSDTIYGGGSDDDIYGGHNVANGLDRGDNIDGAAGNDVIVGDNGLIERTLDATDPRFTVLTGSLIYDSNGLAQVADGNLIGTNPAGVEARRILLFDHDDSGNNADNYGSDVIAGGADDDVIFGQLGADTLHGDGRLDGAALASLTATIDNSDVGGDDYIEGNGGGDTVYGGLGQDDIIGGSSSLYNLTSPSQRPDGADTLFGGNGDLIDRNNYGDTVLPESTRHARDADMILGDNGNIHRLVGINGTDGPSLLTFTYDNYDAAAKIVVRAATLLDYTRGGPDFDSNSAANDIGAGDVIRGESGDDFIYGQVGNDILFGDAQDDDLIGGYGHDWISGGTGQDGVLGDDGRIYTSRNTVGDDAEALSEPLYGIGNVEVDRDSDTLEIGTPGDLQQSFINTLGELKKSVNLTPFNVAPNNGAQDPLYDAQHADDIIYGGLGSDFLHGGAGDDAISGAEALPEYYAAPINNGDVLRYGGERDGEFAAYNEFEPLRRILVDDNGVHTTEDDPQAREFLLNFDAFDAGAPNDPYAAGTGFDAVPTDGNDRLFGDLGNDWLVGGSGRDNLYGGRGDDLMNADDNHDTTSNGADPYANDLPDTHPSYEDIAYGGAGRDVLIANTGGDRLIDWVGEFNSYLVPFAPFGAFTISRSILPQLMEYLYDLSEADGADQTRAADTGSDPLRNGEPDGELGLVMQKDFEWQDQTGAPDDMQPGNIPGGARDVIRAADFNNITTETNDAFAADTGSWTVESGRLQIAPEYLGGDAVSVFYVDSALPSYFEITATINAGKPTAGLKSNTYLIFDYQSATDFKFAGINISTDKLVMGHRTAEGWIVDEQSPARLKPNQDYNVLLALNGTVATLVVNNSEVFSHVYATRTDIYGVTYGLNAGMVGIGSENSIGAIDNVAVQVLPPELTLDAGEDFEDGVADRFTGLLTGDWEILNGRYTGVPQSGAAFATSALDVKVGASYLLRLDATFSTQGMAGLVFDQYSTDDFKFAVLSVSTNEVMIGHYTERGGWQVDAVVDRALEEGRDYNLEITLKGTTIGVVLDGQAVLGHAFNAPLVDGASGVLTGTDGASFDDVTVQTNDPVYFDPNAVEINPIETYNNSQSTAIPDKSVLLSTIEVADAFTLADINVELTISHTRLSDLRVVLVSASGTRIELFNGIGGSSDNFTATLLDDEAADSLLDGTAPYTGSFRPTGDLALLEGENVNGTWTLEVYDQAKREIGTLDSWSLIASRGDSLLASGTPTETLSGQDVLTEIQLTGIVNEAIRRWSDSGLLDADQLAALNDINVEIAELGGTTLGLTTADTIYIDSDAAGFGWFVDQTAGDDAEFADPDGDGLYAATTSSEADGRMDLLTVVLHEIGHTLGLEHTGSESEGLMNEALADSTRIVMTTDTQAQDASDDSVVADEQMLLQASSEFYYRYKRGIWLDYLI